MSIHRDDIGKLLLRLSIGGLMLFHGVDKLIHGHDGIVDMLNDKGLPEILVFGVHVGEVLAPLLILAGVWSRIGAALVGVTMVMAVYLAKSDAIFVLNDHGAPKIELNLMYLLGSLAIYFLGAGKISLRKGKGRLD